MIILYILSCTNPSSNRNVKDSILREQVSEIEGEAIGHILNDDLDSLTTVMSEIGSDGTLSINHKFEGTYSNIEELNGRTALHIAIEAGAASIINWILNNNGYNIGNQDNNGNTAVYSAIRANDLDAFTKILGRESGVVTVDGVELQSVPGVIAAHNLNGAFLRPIHILAQYNRADMLEALLLAYDNATDIDDLFTNGSSIIDSIARDGSGNTALHIAVNSGSEEVAALLIEAGIDISIKNTDGLNAFHLSAYYGVDRNSSIDARESINNLKKQIDAALADANDQEQIIRLNEFFIRGVGRILLEESNSMFFVILRGYLNRVGDNLSDRTDFLFEETGRGDTILQLAIASDNMEVANFILDFVSGMPSEASYRDTLLRNMMISYGSISTNSVNHLTPLAIAISKANLSLVTKILAIGVPNVINRTGVVFDRVVGEAKLDRLTDQEIVNNNSEQFIAAVNNNIVDNTDDGKARFAEVVRRSIKEMINVSSRSQDSKGNINSEIFNFINTNNYFLS